MDKDDVLACDCPRCDGFAERILKADRRENDLYHCMEHNCGYIFESIEYWSQVRNKNK